VIRMNSVGRRFRTMPAKYRACEVVGLPNVRIDCGPLERGKLRTHASSECNGDSRGTPRSHGFL
jgi:hypothetical protein